MTFMYVAWTCRRSRWPATAWRTLPWQAMLACFLFNGLETAGTIVWATTKQRLVRVTPRPGLEPRLVRLDRAAPVSFALTGPVAVLIGARATLIGAGILGAVVTFSFLFLRGCVRSNGPRSCGCR